MKSLKMFGNYGLKNPIFFENNNNKIYGPFLTHEPEIKFFDINKDDRFVIIGTNEFWNYTNAKVLQAIIQDNLNDTAKISEMFFFSHFIINNIIFYNGNEYRLFKETLKNIAEKNSIFFYYFTLKYIIFQ